MVSASACQRCHEQKVRCSRDVPSCLKCQKAKAICQYPTSSNRRSNTEKRYAALQREGGAPRTAHAESSSTAVSSALNTSEGWVNPSFANADHNLPRSGASIDPDSIDGIPLNATLDGLLQRIFFHYIFTSTLMLHREVFEVVNNQQNQVPHHLRAAMYALASNFLDPPCRMALPLLGEIQCLGDTKLLGRQWAESAGRACLQHMDRPEVYDVQTAAILAFYWSSKGDQTRNTMFQQMAWHASRTFLVENNTSYEQDSWMAQEIKHRVFWASYLQISINADQYIVGSSMDTFLPRVPLPSTQTSFLRRIREMRITVPEFENMAVSGQNNQFEPNIWAEILRLTIHWSKIRDHAETRSRSMNMATLSESARLEQWLSDYHLSISKSIRFDLRHVNEDVSEECLTGMYAMEICFNSCRLQLHAPLVLHYNKRDSSQDISLEILRSNAQAAIEGAQSMSRIAEDMLTTNIEMARLSPFLGHSMYVAASIHICFLSLPGERGHRAWHDFVVLLKIIRSMMTYWNYMQVLWDRLLRQFDNQLSLHGNDKAQRNIESRLPNDSSTAMRQLVHFGGSLADAVLNYRLLPTEDSSPVDYSSPAMTRLKELMSETQPSSSAVSTNNEVSVINTESISDGMLSTPNIENLQSFTPLPSELEILASLPPQLFLDNDYWQSFEPSDPNFLPL